ncbi:hypothetical protein EZS27_011842 [termite gut metagenome]|uniref:DUF4843 domain-containing protein n=1 Tax=termite gut metagenome TaxID=433724 RepID=A0A5J4S3J8_9ZZZZ
MNLIDRKKYVFSFLGIVLFFSSCHEDKLDLYAGGEFSNQTSHIYFSLQRWTPSGINYTLNYPIGTQIHTQKWQRIVAPQDSITKSYALDPSGTASDTVYIPVSLMGLPVNRDRTFRYTTWGETNAEEGRDFRVIAASIPANEVVGAILVEIEREAIKDTAFVIDFLLLTNEEFQTNYTMIKRSSSDTTQVDLREFRLRVSDFLEVPKLWGTIRTFLGDFSRKKLYLLRDVAHADLNELYASHPNLILMNSWGSILKRYLADQKEAGNTIYEDDGVTEMKSGQSV